ncbi:MAG TPA: homoserine dehydrogenase [Candidatus Angelobacter sp.]|nr:homoserine dehydrogenase [Candidatus Angelobacter sp.]
MQQTEEAVTLKISEPEPIREVRIGIVGYGTVGRATAEILAHNAEEIRQRTDGISIRVTRVFQRNASNSVNPEDGILYLNDWTRVVSVDADTDIIVEALGGVDTSSRVARASIENGKAFVTSNKALIAQCGEELFALAAAKSVPIGIEATVGGGVPVIRAVVEALAADRLHAVYGIVNGTANFILTQMETHGVQFADALKQAQAAGYAEADPSLDIDGLDARDKISILARLAFNTALSPKQVAVTGIRHVTATDFHYARRLESTIRLVAAAERNPQGITVSVEPWLVERESMLAKVDGPNNAIFLVGEKVGTQMLYGRGAGGGATGTAVLSDVVQIAKHIARGQTVPNNLQGFYKPEKLALEERKRPVSWYLRLTVRDHPGILARVADAIARENVNIDSVIQEPHMPKERLSFVITLEPVGECVVRRAVQAINKFEFMLEPVLVLPIVSSC